MLKEEDVDDLNFVEPQGIDNMKILQQNHGIQGLHSSGTKVEQCNSYQFSLQSAKKQRHWQGKNSMESQRGKTCTHISARFRWWNWKILLTAHARNCYFVALQTTSGFALRHLHIDGFALNCKDAAPKAAFPPKPNIAKERGAKLCWYLVLQTHTLMFLWPVHDFVG